MLKKANTFFFFSEQKKTIYPIRYPNARSRTFWLGRGTRTKIFIKNRASAVPSVRYVYRARPLSFLQLGNKMWEAENVIMFVEKHPYWCRIDFLLIFEYSTDVPKFFFFFLFSDSKSAVAINASSAHDDELSRFMSLHVLIVYNS